MLERSLPRLQPAVLLGCLLGVLAPAAAQPAPPVAPPAPVVLPDVGTLHLPRAPAMVIGNNLAFDGAATMALGIHHAATGACAYEGAIVVTNLAEVANRPFAEGYWGTVGVAEDSLYGCLDLRDGYLSVVLSPGSQLTAAQPVLAEIRRAAYVTHGAPITNESDPMILPATQQRVSARHGVGAWKVVDGGRLGLAGADVLVSTSTLGVAGTFFSIAVREESCPADTRLPEGTAPLAGDIAPLPSAVASGVFPPKLGSAWMDARDYRIRWHAWTCVKGPGGEATVHVLAPTAHDEPPDRNDLYVLRPLIEAIVRSYGVEPAEVVPSPGGGGRHHRHRSVRALVGGYLGVISFAAGDGERRYGGLLGLDGRVAADSGFAVAFDLELGYGAGELIGELRGGVGLSMGALDLVAGLGLGSIGPAAAMDLYGQAGLTVPYGRRSRAWLGGMYAVGVGGPDHLQADLKLVRTTRADAGLFLGARLMWFGDDADTMADHGTAVMVMFGGGAASD